MSFAGSTAHRGRFPRRALSWGPPGLALLALALLGPARPAAGLPPLEGPEFTLGPYRVPLPPAPVALRLRGVPAAPVAVAVELDEGNRRIAAYPCTLFEDPDHPGFRRASFLPFPLPGGGAEWPAGRRRRFRIQPATAAETAGLPGLVLERSAAGLVVGNAMYRMALAPVEAPLAGPAHGLVRRIAVAGSPRALVPTRTVSDLTARSGGRDVIYEWHFDPARPPRITRHGPRKATARYAGFYQAPGGERLEGVEWEAAFTFFADSPLVRIRFVRRQEPARTFFGRSLQVYFSPSDPGWPVASGQVARQEGRRWVALNAPDAQIAFLLHDGRTSGLSHWSPNWGYLCASWEAQGFRLSRPGDAREFFLFLNGSPESGAALTRRVEGLQILGEADWHARIHALFGPWGRP